jgi:uncharacterized membrane protein (TIGR01666 family)
MIRPAQEFRLFLYSQQLADGIRTSIAVLLPALVCSYLGYFDIGIIISLGAVCVSLVDAPGPIIHRKNSMLFCLLFVFITAVVTGYARLDNLTMGAEVLLFSFFFSMFSAYGVRAAMIGNAALLTMVLTMDNPIEINSVLQHSLFIAGGGAWYMLISLLAYKVRPYRASQRALGECIRELAVYLSIKADFYDCETSLDEAYRKLLAQQVVVSEKQDAVRELLFKTRETLKESTPEGRALVLAFIDSVDLFEEVTASYYDYKAVRDRYKTSGILETISALIKEMAIELDHIGAAIHMNISYRKRMDYAASLATLKKQIDEQAGEGEESHIIVKKILVNLRKIMQRFTDLLRYFETPLEKEKRNPSDHSLFVGHQSLDPKIFWNNLSLHSSVFKNSVRVSVACIFAFIIAKSIAYSHHSYWIVMTVMFMVKPAFSLTKQRNYERIAGTLLGGALGVIILLLVKDIRFLFAFMVLFMTGTYSFQRVKYFVAVVCMTPYILILFHFFGIGFRELLQERVLDTLIGCAIAVLSGYLVFPNWEYAQLRNHMRNMLKANNNYFQKIRELLSGHDINLTEYKLARKEVYVHSANLSAALQRMLSEPKSKQKNKREIHQFVVLNHILFSNIATIVSTVLAQPKRKYPNEIIRSANKMMNALCSSLKKLDEDCKATPASDHKEDKEVLQGDDLLLKEQLEFLYRVSVDIAKTIDKIIGEPTIRQPVHSLSVQGQ